MDFHVLSFGIHSKMKWRYSYRCRMNTCSFLIASISPITQFILFKLYSSGVRVFFCYCECVCVGLLLFPVFSTFLYSIENIKSHENAFKRFKMLAESKYNYHAYGNIQVIVCKNSHAMLLDSFMSTELLWPMPALCICINVWITWISLSNLCCIYANGCLAPYRIAIAKRFLFMVNRTVSSVCTKFGAYMHNIICIYVCLLSVCFYFAFQHIKFNEIDFIGNLH